jgi:hypothetical protein
LPTQRRKGAKEDTKKLVAVFFAPLRLCVGNSYGSAKT